MSRSRKQAEATAAVQRLVERYTRLLYNDGLLQALIRSSPDTAERLSPHNPEVAYRASFNKMGLSSFAKLHPIQRWIELRHLEVRAALKHMRVVPPWCVFVGMLPLDRLPGGRPAFGGSIQRDGADALILIDGHSLSFLAETVELLVQSMSIDDGPTLDSSRVVSEFTALLAEHAMEVTEFNRTGQSRVFFAPQRTARHASSRAYQYYLKAPSDKDLLASEVTNACLRFIIAHEYGHLMAGHGWTSLVAGEAAELEADFLAANILLHHSPSFDPELDCMDGHGYTDETLPWWTQFCALTTLSIAEAIDNTAALLANEPKSDDAEISAFRNRQLKLADFLNAHQSVDRQNLAVAGAFDRHFRELVHVAQKHIPEYLNSRPS